MRVDEAGLDPRVAEHLIENGIEEFYPPQAEAVPLVLAGESLMLSVPTAAGKSLVAYLGILNCLTKRKKAIYIVPLRALAHEKYEEIQEFEFLGFRTALTIGDYDSSDDRLASYDVIIATSEKVDALLRHRPDWLDEIGLVVADEIHLLTDPKRGPTMEVNMARLKGLGAQIIGLSATVVNASEMAEWLDAELVTSDWRPVPLMTGIHVDGSIEFTEGEVLRADDIQEHVLKRIKDGGQALIFLNSRKRSQKAADDYAAALNLKNDEIEDPEGESTEVGERLIRCMKRGAAFHNASLTNRQRKMVENAFRDGKIKVIGATPTLAAGINLPARTVIVQDTKRYSDGGRVPLSILEVHQMMGRAGRPRYDSWGEAILVAGGHWERDALLENYLLSPPEPVSSKLGSLSALRTHILSSFVLGECRDVDELMEFIGSTFFGHQKELFYLEGRIMDVLSFLTDEGMLEEGDEGVYKPTAFGIRTSQLYVDPLGASLFKRAALNWMEESETIELLQAGLSGPDLFRRGVRKTDQKHLARYLDSDLRWLLDEDDLDDDFLPAVKSAAVLNDWIEEVPERVISDKFGIGPGDLRNDVETAMWLVGAFAEISALFNKDCARSVRPIEKRIKAGIKAELLPLVKIDNVGRVRGRALFTAGYTSPVGLRMAKEEELARIPKIGPKIARQIKEQLGQEKRQEVLDVE